MLVDPGMGRQNSPGFTQAIYQGRSWRSGVGLATSGAVITPWASLAGARIGKGFGLALSFIWQLMRRVKSQLSSLLQRMSTMAMSLSS